ncbi:hypothetical protein EKH55_2238 [Sinorhizobium alkalisoli]|nr:hypothetical protein EKH55_2238 [Sinorhizobium alkalisoli]
MAAPSRPTRHLHVWRPFKSGKEGAAVWPLPLVGRGWGGVF